MLNECCDAYVLSSFSLLLEWHQNTGSYRRLLILVMRPVVMYYVGSFLAVPTWDKNGCVSACMILCYACLGGKVCRVWSLMCMG